MATREIKVPRLAESVSEGVVVAWLKPDGAEVAVDEPIVTLETDKAAVEIPSEFAGVLRHARTLGEKVEVGEVLARVEEGATVQAAPTKAAPDGNGGAAKREATAVSSAAPPAAKPAPTPPPAPAAKPAPATSESTLSPAVRRMVEEHGLDPSTIPATGPGGRLLKEDIQKHLDSSPAKESTPKTGEARPDKGESTSRAGLESASEAGERRLDPAGVRAVPAGSKPRSPAPAQPAIQATVAAPSGAPGAAAALAPMRAPTDWRPNETERPVPMSRIRLRIAERLVKAQQTAAILTTFNEVDMSEVMSLRERYREDFEKRHGVRLSYMSFFTRAVVLALERLPELNAEIRGTDVVYRRHVHMGIAVGTERGLVVPVVREADRRSFAELEREIARLSAAARDGSVSLDELSGGTFTISNGGVYGSLLSTPILNFPQSGILGMHKIQKRPVVIDDELVIRPMMYLALSYDHRIVDGEQAVTFLVSVRERLEDPERMLLEV